MEQIFASKLFRCSTRQDKIRAAISNPINAPLVAQLKSYLNDEYTKISEPDKDITLTPSNDDNSVDDNLGDTQGERDVSPNTSSHTTSAPRRAPHQPSTNGPSMDDIVVGDPSSEDDTEVDPTQSDDSDELTPTPDTTEANSSVNVDKSSIKSNHECNIISIDEITGLLNSDSSTSGITRGKLLDKELWLYYNDSVNLNNIMSNVINILDASGHTQLTFNRLARSDNAMGFDVICSPVVDITKSVEDIIDETV